jgi:phosphoglycerate dehydrogenase-like enzyme
MRAPTVLVLGNPTARHLARLDRLPPEAHLASGETEAALAAAAAQAQVVLLAGGSPKLLRALWPRLRRLEWVHSMWAGLEEVLFPELVESPVPLTNSRGVFARSLGEFALAGMLYFAKRIGRMKRQQAAAQWQFLEVEELYDRVLGIVGYGSIGRAAAGLARGFGMRIHVLRRHAGRAAQDPLVDRIYAPAELNALMAASDYLLAAAPLTAETRGLIGPPAIAALKPGAVLLNLGRGPVVAQDALLAALRAGSIRGAVLDVFDQEPLPPDHPFWKMDNVLLSPHTADRTATWLDEAMDLFFENYRRFAAGEPLLNVADKRLGY